MTSAAKSLLLLFIFLGISSLGLAQTPNPRENFARAYVSYSNGSLAEAKEAFREAMDPNFPLADYSLYYLALISFSEGNLDGAREFLSALRKSYPQSLWRYPAELQRAKIYLAEKNYTQATDALRSLRSETGLRPDIVSEAIFLLAQAQEAAAGPMQAYALYSELRTLFPRSRWTVLARAELKRFRETYPDEFGLKTTKAIMEEADRLVREGAFGEAETLYKKLLGSDLQPTFRLTVLTKLADLYLSLRKRNVAIPLLEQIARNYPNTSEASRALYQIGRVLWNRNDNAQALPYFKQIMERYPTSSFVERSRYAAADIYESFGRREEAIALYANIMKHFPNSPVYDDAALRLAWLYYRGGEWERASEMFQNLATHAKDGSLRNMGLYWQARTAEKLDDTESALRLYRQIADGSEESYYQVLAIRALGRAGFPVEEIKLSSPPAAAAEAPPTKDPRIMYHLSRARELSAISLYRMAVAELNEIDRLSRKDAQIHSLLMQEYFKNQAYGRSLSLANQLPSSRSERNLYRFPLAYWDMIQQKAQEQELDPYLVLALIRQESLFDSRARSPATALGLMQLLPSTAGRVARQIGVPPPSNEQLFEPEVNLMLGIQYLKDLLKRYSNNWYKAIAAYNAGEGAVDRWEREILTDDEEEFVERIPYLETRAYVKLVMRNHRIYSRLYDQQK
ncbi:MAG: transglycosylase SLT domain-containing protein [Candidatus Binatia bacterium]